MTTRYSAKVHKNGAIKYGSVNAVFALASFYYWGLGPGFYIFLALTLFFTWYWFTAENRVNKWETEEESSKMQEIPTDSILSENYPVTKFGEFGVIESEGDFLYGMFIKVNELPCFIDLREDENLDARKRFAEYIKVNVKTLEKNLNVFIDQSPELKEIGPNKIRIFSIGLYEKSNFDEGLVNFITSEKDDHWVCGLDRELNFFGLSYC